MVRGFVTWSFETFSRSAQLHGRGDGSSAGKFPNFGGNIVPVSCCLERLVKVLDLAAVMFSL